MTIMMMVMIKKWYGDDNGGDECGVGEDDYDEYVDNKDDSGRKLNLFTNTLRWLKFFLGCPALM